MVLHCEVLGEKVFLAPCNREEPECAGVYGFGCIYIWVKVNAL